MRFQTALPFFAPEAAIEISKQTIMNIKTLAAFLFFSISIAARAADFGSIPSEEIAVYVQDINSGKVLESHRADASVNPASTMKLVTAFTALKVLGQDYRWKTELKTDGEIIGYTLNGDIYWVGSGNPSFDQDELIALQQQLRDKGIRKITGKLVLDRSLWGSVKNPPEFAADAGQTFMTAPDPNMLAYKVVWFKPELGADGKLEIAANPPLPDIQTDNKAVLNDKDASCKSLKNHLNVIYKGGVLHFTGKLPSSCIGEEMFANLFSAQEFAQKSFINQWRKAGGEISDGFKIQAAPQQAQTVAQTAAKPLDAMLNEMNKHSNNLIARSVFLKLGHDKSAETAALEAANIVRRELAESGVNVQPLVLENGAGLSRNERVSVKMMADMLGKAYFSPFKQAFIDSLPIAGTDGTLKHRLAQAGSNLRLKTGTLNNVRALAGYWLGDKPKIVVVIINSPKSGEYLKDLDKLISKIVLPGGDSWVDAKISCDVRQNA